MEVWRIVFEKVASLEEIERSWDLNDLADAHIALDLREKARKKMEPGKKR